MYFCFLSKLPVSDISPHVQQGNRKSPVRSFFKMFNDEDDLAAYEDELYREESSSNEGVDSEVEAYLYSQVHYSQNLSDCELDDPRKEDDATEEEGNLKTNLDIRKEDDATEKKGNLKTNLDIRKEDDATEKKGNLKTNLDIRKEDDATEKKGNLKTNLDIRKEDDATEKKGNLKTNLDIRKKDDATEKKGNLKTNLDIRKKNDATEKKGNLKTNLDIKKKDDATEKKGNLKTKSDKKKSVIVISDSDDVRASDSSAVIILSEGLEEDSVCSSKIKRKVSSAVRRPEKQSPPKVLPGGKKASKLQVVKSLSFGRNYQDGIVQEVVVIRGSSDDEDVAINEEVFLTSDSDQSDVENWMVLGRAREDGDTSIQLNVEGYSCAPSEGDNGEEWSISEKDVEAHNTRFTPLRRSSPRYYTDDKNVICRNCNYRGHLSKNCPQPKKLPACCLCGKRGHLQYTCPTPYCSNCFMPGHFYQDCTERPYWQKKCHRCGMNGHYADACPEIWRQYHLTVVRGPLKRSNSASSPKTIVYCCNCGKKGHCGYECDQRRMYSTVYPSCELVFTYDQNNDIWKRNQRVKQKVKEIQEAGLLTLDAEESDKEDTVDNTQLPKKILKRNKKAKKQTKTEDGFAKNSLRRLRDKKKKMFLQHEEEREYFPRGKSEKPQKCRRRRKTTKPEPLLFKNFCKNEGLDDRFKKGKKKLEKQNHFAIDPSLLRIKQRKKKSKTK